MDVVTTKLNTILFTHINHFYEHYDELLNANKIDYNLINSINTSTSIKFKSQMHIALISRQHEIEYLRESSKRLLQLVLPDAYKHK